MVANRACACYTILKQEVNSLKEDAMFTPKQVGKRIKERRIELGLSMPELGKRIGVNKSTIQRYEADGVDPKRLLTVLPTHFLPLPNG